MLILIMQHPDRKNIRLPDYDYSSPGCYFVTICTFRKRHSLGLIKDEQSILNKNGKLVSGYWASIPDIYSNVELDEFVVMPNHIHGLITIVAAGSLQEGTIPTDPINSVGVGSADPHDDARKTTIPSIVARFKKTSTTAINRFHNSRGSKVWQRNYYEHVIRNELELTKAREYIVNNPMKWTLDKYR